MQQPDAHVAHEVAGITQLAADQRNVAGEFLAQRVLHHAQCPVDAVDDAGRVVEHAQQAELAEVVVHDVLDVGHRDVEQLLAGHRAGRTAEKASESGCGGRCGEVAQRERADGKTQLHRQVHAEGAFDRVREVVAQALAAKVEATVVDPAAAQLVELDGEAGVVLGAGQAIAVDGGPAADHTDLGRTGLEAHVQVLTGGAHAQGDVGAAGLIGGHRHCAVGRHARKQLLAPGAAQLALFAGEQLHLHAQLGAQPALQVEQGRLTPASELVGAMDRIGVARLAAAEPIAVDAGGDPFDAGASLGDRLAHVAQDGRAGVGADAAAAVGKDGRAKSGHRHRLDAGGVVVIKEEFRRAACKPDARFDLQLGHGRQRDLAGGAGVDHIGQRIDEVHPRQRARPGDGRQLLQVQAKAKLLLKHLVELEVDVQRVAVEAEREDLVFGAQAVVVGDAQSTFENTLDLTDGGRRVVGRLLNLLQEAVDEGEHIGQRAPDHRQHHRIEGLVGDGIAHEFQAHAGGIDHVAERQVLEVEGGTQVGHDDDQIARAHRAGPHQGGQVGGIGRVLVDHPGGARIEQVQRRHRQLDVGRQRDVGAHAGVELQAAQARLGRALQAEVDVGGADFAEGKALVQCIAAARVFVQRDAGTGAEGDARAGALAACAGLEEAHLQADFQVGDARFNTGLEGDVLDAHGEAVFTQRVAQLLGGGVDLAVQADAAPAGANTDHGVLLASQLQAVAQHGAVKQKSAV